MEVNFINYDTFYSVIKRVPPLLTILYKSHIEPFYVMTLITLKPIGYNI